ncbi:unnamed protein product [Brassica oleracea]
MRERKLKSGYVLKDFVLVDFSVPNGRLQKPGHVKKNQTQRVLQDLLIITIHIFLFQAFPPSQSHLPSTQQIQCIQRPPPAFYNGICTSNALQGHASFNPHANTSLSSRGLAIINLFLSSP